MTSGRGTAVWVAAGAGLMLAAAALRGLNPVSPSGVIQDTASPGVRFVSVALGGFRGLLADALWVRASALQDEGRFYELVQLAEWITQLEPRHADVWAYHAWNLAYNVSVLFPDPQDRWRWVSHGVRLLRDQGIPANPRDDQLHWELGWLYVDKVGGSLDEAQSYYRVAFALEMTPVFPEGRADYPALARPEASAALASLRLRPDTMATLDRTYGPLDWRLPATHAIYWGYTGREAGRARSAWCTRLIYQGLLDTVRGGRLVFDPRQRLYARGPRLDVAAKAAALAQGDPEALAQAVSVAPVENLLRESMVILYAFGHEDQAVDAWRALRQFPGVTVGTNVVAGVQEECRERVGGFGDGAHERIMERLLTQRWIWERVGDSSVARGFERLAGLHWEAIQQVAAPGASIRRPGTFDRLNEEARRAAGEETAGVEAGRG